MKIFNLTQNSKIYTSNVFFVLGTWNALDDVNTLIDVGRDPIVIDEILKINTGLGKAKVDQVVITHNHYDHTSMLPIIKKQFSPDIYAYSRSLDNVNHYLKDLQTLRIADQLFEIIYTPGHSHDSVCLYCEKEGILFAGDTPLIIHTVGGSYEKNFVKALEKINRRDVNIIYPGHGKPIDNNCNSLLHRTLDNVRKSIRK